MKQARSYRIKYGATHGLFQAASLITAGFLSTYMLAFGYSNAHIGLVLAISNIVAAILQPVLGEFLDKSKKLTLPLFCCLLLFVCTALSVILLIQNLAMIPRGILAAAIICLLYLIQPLMNSMNFMLNHMGIETNFGLCRGIGSISYAIASLILGFVFAYYDTKKIPIFYIICFVIYFVIFWSLRDIKRSNLEQTNQQTGELSSPLSLLDFAKKYRKFMLFLLGCSLLLAAQYLFSYFALQIVMPLGGTTREMGIAIAIQAAIELPVMAIIGRINRKIAISKMLIFSAIMFCIKYFLTFIAGNLTMLYIAMMTEALCYAVYYPSVTLYVDRVLSRADLVKGQALLTTTYTIAGILGSLLGGLILNFTNIKITLGIFTFIGIIGTIIFIISMEEIE